MVSALRRHLRSFIRGGAGSLPFSLDVQGRRRDLLLAWCDRIAGPARGVETIGVGDRSLSVDLGHVNERVLAFFYWNLLRGHRHSGLFRYLATRPGSKAGVFVDVGANLGLCSLVAQEMGYETILFEPEPRHGAFLERNVAVFGTVARVALGDRTDEADFYVAGDANPGGGSLVMSDRGWDASGYQQRITVAVERFDRWVETRGVDPARLTFVKVDVEGNEEASVRGFDGVLAAGARPGFWCEVRGPSSDRNPNSAAAVAAYLGTYGYRPYEWADGRRLPFDLGRPEIPQVFDLLFEPGELA